MINENIVIRHKVSGNFVSDRINRTKSTGVDIGLIRRRFERIIVEDNRARNRQSGINGSNK